MRGRAVAVCGIALAIGAGTAGVVAAQAPPAALTITLEPRKVTVGATQPVPAGPTRIEFRSTGRRDPQDASLVALRPGVTLAQLRAAVARSDDSPIPVKRVATFEAGSTVTPAGTYATTIDLKPNTT